MSVPAAVLTALGRLNAHARVRGGWGTEREAIYLYKRLAALLLIRDGAGSSVAAADPRQELGAAAGVRFIRMTAKCRGCSDGWWTDWDGDRRRCRWCNAGHVVLRFTETVMPDGQVWHHPWEGRTSPGIELAQAAGLRLCDDGDWVDAAGTRIVWEDPGDWSPMQPGVPLALEELVTLLNVVEDWVEALPAPEYLAPQRWWVNGAKRCLHQWLHHGVIGAASHRYRLDLGRFHARCFVCGTSDDLQSACHAQVTPLFHWSLKVCKQHACVRHPDRLPPSGVIFPELQRWIARHERVVEGG